MLHLHYTSQIKKTPAIVYVVITLMTILLMGTNIASATDKQISTKITDCTTPSKMVIDSPSDSSTFTALPINISGHITHISQIQVYVDDKYNETMPTGVADASFSYGLTVSPGSHTVRLEAVDACQQSPITKDIALTYKSEPTSDGVISSTGQNVPPATNTSNSTPSGAAIKPKGVFDSIPFVSLPVVQSAIDTAYSTLVKLDFISESSLGSIAPMTMRFGFVFTGLVAMVFPTSVLRLSSRLAKRVPRLSELSLPNIMRSHSQLVVHASGILLLFAPIFFMP